MRIHGQEHFAALDSLLKTYHIAGGTFIHFDRPDFYYHDIKPSLFGHGIKHEGWLAVHHGINDMDRDAIRCFVLGA